ncbi:hypothetical protein L1049_018284 [Liquidambar formosana]|uniref:BED-type domain-containing protein n=1 Tax=Liquidambar formosana TaxID=63359 RepID=A0AAP0WLY5_LIQFO
MGDSNPQSVPPAAPTTTATSTPATSSANVSPPRKKLYKKKSIAWENFIELKGPDGKSLGRARCRWCEKECGCSSVNGTTSMLKHIARCAKYPYNEDKKQKLLSFKSVGHLQDSDCHSSSLSNWKFDQELCRQALTKMIIVDELPFKFVEREGFKNFVSVLQPRFQLLSRSTVATDCLNLYKNEKVKLKNVLKNCVQRISLTTDLWTSLQNISYMCLTGHFIDKDWKLQKRILNFCVVTSHKGEVIGHAIESCLLEWGLENVCTITVDNASNNDTAVAYLKKKYGKKNGGILGGEFMHMRCCAHILNLIVKDGLSDVHDSIARIRGAVKYIRSSPARAEIFKKCVEQERIKSKRSLCLDVPTRWNSTYLMLDTALKFQKAFERLEEQDLTFKWELKEGIPGEEDWNNARVFTQFLETFYETSNRMSGSLYVTSNSYFEEICTIENTISDWSKSLDPYLSSMAIRMKLKFDKYWGDIDKVNLMVVIAVVLDPRCKLEYVNFCYSMVYQPIKVEALCKRVKETLDRLFDQYKLFDSSLGVSPTQVGQSSGEMEVDKPDSEVQVPKKNLKQCFLKHRQEKEGGVLKSEVDKYLEESVENDDSSFDILVWWKMNCKKYPTLAMVAREVLSIPVSTVASECAFSTGGRVLDQFRSSLTPKVVECLICAQDWLRASPIPIDVEETLEELEELESGIF